MAFKASSSRFAFLVDDAPDPFVTSKKGKSKSAEGGSNTSHKQDQSGKSKKKAGGGGGSANGNKNSSTSATKGTDRKELQQMAFGLEGQKKKNKTPPPKPDSVQSSDDKSNGENDNESGGLRRPEHMSDEQWQAWRQRDSEYVSGTFESDLEAALMQSKLDYQQQQTRLQQESQPKTKAKKKPVAVPLGEFHAMLNNEGSLAAGPKVNPEYSTANGHASSFPEDDMERFRRETQMEMKREMQLELEREMLQSRNHQVPLAPISGLDDLESRHILEQKDAIITKLSAEKMELERELEISRARFKKLWSIVGEANMKDVVFLSAQVEKLTQMNQQLTEEISSLHSQLEQERSRSHVALLELRRLEQSRRRVGSLSEN